jgi:hypothetical protein
VRCSLLEACGKASLRTRSLCCGASR